MTTFERRQKLLEILRKQPGMRVPDLADLLQVSQGTIRNDLDALAEEGELMRVHGGAAVADFEQAHSPTFHSRLKKNQAEKEAIALRAAAQVEDGDSILLDASTTVYYLARVLKEHRNLRVITNGIESARILARNPTNSVIVLGGSLNVDGSIIKGTLSEQVLQDLHAKTAFISCSGFTPEIGMTEIEIEEASLKTKMIRAAVRSIALVDSSKFGKVDLTTFAQMAQIAHLYTDAGLERGWVDQLKQTSLSFSICGKDSITTFPPGYDG